MDSKLYVGAVLGRGGAVAPAVRGVGPTGHPAVLFVLAGGSP